MTARFNIVTRPCYRKGGSSGVPFGILSSGLMMVVFHDGQRRGGFSDRFMLLARLEQHCLTRAEVDDLVMISTDAELPADHHQQLDPRRRVPSNLPAGLQHGGDHVGGTCASQQHRTDSTARRIDRVVDRDTRGTECIELGGHDLDDLHQARLDTAPR